MKYREAVQLIVERVIRERANDHYMLLIKACIKKELIDILVHILMNMVKKNHENGEDDDLASDFKKAWNILLNGRHFLMPKLHQVHEKHLTTFKDLLLTRGMVEVSTNLSCCQCGIIRPGLITILIW